MSTDKKTYTQMYKLVIPRIKGVTRQDVRDFIQEALSRYKGGLWPDDGLMQLNAENVKVHVYLTKQPFAWAVMPKHGTAEGFPKVFMSRREAEDLIRTWPGDRQLMLQSLVTHKQYEKLDENNTTPS